MSLLTRVVKDLFTDKASPEVPSARPSVILQDEWIRRVFEKLNEGNLSEAAELCAQAREQHPDDEELVRLGEDITNDQVIGAAKEFFPGPQYLEWLRWFHFQLRPAAYLEVGVESGLSLQYTLAPTRAVGVDPAIRVTHSQENWVKLFKLPSDDFFAKHDVPEVFGTDTIDFAFIDGLHTFDQALKDFINIEKFSSNKTVVLFHDIYPVAPITAERDRRSTFWLGDTWKVLFILLKSRPDLKIFTIPTFPSGLGVVTNLDASSRVLSDGFEAICQQAMAVHLQDVMADFGKQVRAVKNDFNEVAQLLGLPPEASP